VFALSGAGGPSGLLLDLTIPEGGDDDQVGDDSRGSVLSVEVPLHARYGVPKMEGGELVDEVLLPPPEAFWACAQREATVDDDGGGASLSFHASLYGTCSGNVLQSHNVVFFCG
jgi:PIG-X / PBN1